MKLLDFYATWCEPCKWADPVIRQVVTELAGLFVLEKIDIDSDTDLASRYGVRSVPTFILTDGDKEIWRMNGFDSAPKMIAAIREAISKHSK